jgi:hypothetical protein
MEWLGYSLLVLLFVAIFGFMRVLSARDAKQKSQGFSSAEVRRLQAQGQRASAVVLSSFTSFSNTVGMHYREIVVEVRPQGGPAFRAPVRFLCREHEAGQPSQGDTVPVLFDPRQPQRVFVDRGPLRREQELGGAEWQAQKERRHRELLNEPPK